MAGTSALFEVVAYLDAVQDLYPGGVPLQSSEEESARPSAGVSLWGNECAPLLFVVDLAQEQSSAGTPFSGERGELLEAAVTKGLKLELDQVQLLLTAPQRSLGAAGLAAVGRELAVRLAASRAVWAVVLGGLLGEAVFSKDGGLVKRGEWCQVGAVRLLLTHELDLVLQSKSAKREFWSDLQQVLARLKE